MSNITRQINLRLDVTQMPVHLREVIDADTGEPLVFYRANSVVFSVIFLAGTANFDMSAVAKASLEVKKPDGIGSPPPNFGLRMYKEAVGEFETGEAVGFEFDAYETAIQDGNNWLSITLYSEADEVMTTVSGFVNVLGNGFGIGDAADAEDARDKAVKAAKQSCRCAARSEAAAGESVDASVVSVAAADRAEAAASGASGSTAEAVAAAAAAKASETSAQASSTAAQNAATGAAASETTAAASEAVATTAATNASGSATAAAASATSAGQGAAEAETSRAAAVVARNQAENFRNDARDSATSAGNSAADAQAAKQFSEAASATAVTASTAAVAARDEAVPAALAAISARDVATGAASTATMQATRSETEANRSTTQANRSEAEATRAQGIADNLQSVAEALSYRGEWSGAAAPTGALRGQFWVISAATTWGGITWAVGDAALYNGSVWQRVALDWLLAQANINTESLRKAVSIAKQSAGGIYQTHAAHMDLMSNPIPIGTGDFDIPLTAAYDGTISGGSYGLLGYPTGGTTILGYVPNPGAWRINAPGGTQLAQWTLPLTAGRESIVRIRRVAGTLSVLVDGVQAGQLTGDTTDFGTIRYIGHRVSTGTNFGWQGVIRNLSAYNRGLTTTEYNDLAATGCQIIPLTARADNTIFLSMDDGAGFQCRDKSGNGRHALLSPTGCTHLLPRDAESLSAASVNASSAGYLLREGATLEVNSAVTNVICGGTVATPTVEQNLNLTRIRLLPEDATLHVQRSNGTTHQTIATFAPLSLASVNLKINAQKL